MGGTDLFERLLDDLGPLLHGVVDAVEAVVGDVVGQQADQPLLVHVGAELDVVLLGGDHGQVLLLERERRRWVRRGQVG